MSIEEYLLFEETATTKHEYLDGETFAMTGGTLAHNKISTNILKTLFGQLESSGCNVYMSDVKVRIEANNSFYYPDVLVDCGSYQKERLFVESPSIIFEVLSPSTAATDRREKLVAYKRIPSLKAYVIVQQSRKLISVYLRSNAEDWTIQEMRSNDDFSVELFFGRTVKLSVNEIYEGTDIDDGAKLSIREEAEIYVW